MSSPAPQPLTVPTMLRGTVVTNRRRCGKPTCRCATSEDLHETIVLSYSDGGRTRFLSLPDSEVAAVRAAAERYRRAQAKLKTQANAGLAELVAQLSHRGRR